VWWKALVLAALPLAGASAAWTASSREAAVPITGVRPVYSPDGKRIAFADLVGSTVNGSWAIFVVNADGTGRRQLVRGSTYPPHGISWSPDGASVAYDAFVGGGPTSVYTVPAGGGSATRVTTGWSPAWGPGGRILVTDEFVSQFGGDVRLYSVKPDGSGRQTFVECPELQFDQPCHDGDAAWSPDGKHIAFDVNLFGAASAIAVMNADGSGRITITSFSPPATLPQWSPDGKQLVYEQLDLDGDQTKDAIHVVNAADGGGDKALVANAHQPTWSADGKTIVFTRSQGSDTTLFAMNADGSSVHQLTGPGTGTTTTTTTKTAVKCVVPKVVGKTLATARKLLTKAHCKTGTVTNVRSAKVAKGRVVSAKPKPGTSHPSGSAVALAVSRGKK
jgi:Tol biopolymer transport system component